jgi:hypothetical protein
MVPINWYVHHEASSSSMAYRRQAIPLRIAPPTINQGALTCGARYMTLPAATIPVRGDGKNLMADPKGE